MTFVVVTHELPSIFTIAGRVIMVDKGTKGSLAEGRPQDMKEYSENPPVPRFFNREWGREPWPSRRGVSKSVCSFWQRWR